MHPYRHQPPFVYQSARTPSPTQPEKKDRVRQTARTTKLNNNWRQREHARARKGELPAYAQEMPRFNSGTKPPKYSREVNRELPNKFHRSSSSSSSIPKPMAASVSDDDTASS